MNIFTGIGRMTKSPELAYSKNGVAVCKFIIAIDRQFQKDETDFLPVTCFKAVAENTAKYCDKGSKVAINGNVQTSNYEKDGQRVYKTDIIAQSVQFLDTKKSNDQQTDPFEGQSEPEEFDENSLPF